jgi:leader peptidase (prepilin peptidase)/N-methyltransferase
MEVILISIIFFVFGTIFGSFYNVVAYRLPNNMSIVYPPSHCPHCNHKLSVLELIPILSYIIQRGKCKHCKKKIGSFYPIFELLTGIAFLFSYIIFGFSPMLYISLVFSSTLLIVISCDIKYMIIPDEVILFSSIILVILRVVLLGFNDILNIVLDAAIPFIVMLGIKLLGDKLFKKESLGGGDIKLMIVFGLAIGFEMAIFSIFAASFIAFPISLYMLLKHKKHILPFGPYLSIAALLLFFLKIDLNYVLNLLLWRV